MSLINFTIYCNFSNCRGRSSTVNDFQEYFHQELSATCLDGGSLSQVYIGKGKDALDLVDSQLVILEVTPLFGPFIKYAVDQSFAEQMEVCLSLTYTHKILNFCSCCAVLQERLRISAFSIMMHAQRKLAKDTVARVPISLFSLPYTRDISTRPLCHRCKQP